MLIDVNFQMLKKHKIKNSYNHKLMFHMKLFVLFLLWKFLLNKTDILIINLAKPTWTIFTLLSFYLHFKGFYAIGIFQTIWKKIPNFRF